MPADLRPPGTGWRYSNTGYLLAGMIIEKVTGTPWYEEVDRRILTPLGLVHTSYPGSAVTIPAPHATGYTQWPTGGLVDTTENRLGVFAAVAGALITTTADLNTFLRALLGGKLLQPEQLAEMRKTVDTDAEVGSIFPGARYGPGPFLDRIVLRWRVLDARRRHPGLQNQRRRHRRRHAQRRGIHVHPPARLRRPPDRPGENTAMTLVGAFGFGCSDVPEHASLTGWPQGPGLAAGAWSAWRAGAGVGRRGVMGVEEFEDRQAGAVEERVEFVEHVGGGGAGGLELFARGVVAVEDHAELVQP
ncbi:serine hydrolase domain-containing protein [Nocardia pseudobrasiliensis]|uniref:serine hydrolase domain-containing protein n=1 Tax=Nocardia pseudobrasiliensis TaxID=45979 RepID=UPI000E0B87D1|nr:serine hydrolase domain-containing protein [Nocardia pseudobrasiliensis]